MNILITGASRGIGAAAYALLKKTGHNVVGHSTEGSDELVAGDLANPGAPRNIWDTALDELGGHVDVLVNNAGIYEAVADNVSDDEWHSAWHRTMTINLQAAADLSRLAVSHILDRGGGGRIVNVASRAAYRGDSPAALALCRVESGDGRNDQDHRARLCGRGHSLLRGRARASRCRR